MIANRTLNFKIKDRIFPVEIRVFPPERQPEGHWFCRYEVDWPDRPRQNRAGGQDAIQALLGAFGMIGAELYTSDYHKNGQILPLDESWVGYGFPVPHNLRDLLIGQDAEYL